MPSRDEMMSELPLSIDDLNRAMVECPTHDNLLRNALEMGFRAHALDREVRELREAIVSAEHACRRLGEDIDREVLIDIADSLKAALAPAERGDADGEQS